MAISLVGGSREEKPENIGLTHLLEHMLFKRTQKQNAFEIACEIDRLGGGVNACTDTDEMVIYGETAPDGLLAMLELFAEILLEPGFTEGDLVLEKEVIRQEIVEAIDDPDAAAFNRLSELFWPESSFGMPVFGYENSVLALSYTQVLGRLKELLYGRKIVIAVCGNFDQKVLQAKVEQLFSGLPKGDYPERQEICNSYGADRLKREVELVHIAVAMKSAALEDEDYPASVIFSALLGEGMASRLFQEIREKRGLAYDVCSDLESTSDTAMILIRATAQPEKAAEVMDIISLQLEDLAKQGPSLDEVARARASIVVQNEIDTGIVGSTVWRMIETEHLYGRFVSASSFAERIRNISFDDVKNYAFENISESPLALVIAGAVDTVPVTKLEEFCLNKK